MLNFSHRDIKAIIRNMFKEVNKTMQKDLMATSQELENINREMEIIFLKKLNGIENYNDLNENSITGGQQYI